MQQCKVQVQVQLQLQRGIILVGGRILKSKTGGAE